MASRAASLGQGGRPLRFLMTTDSVGGVWQYSLDLIRELGRVLSSEVLLLSLGPKPTAAQQEQASVIPNLQLESAEFALEWMPDCWGDVDAAGSWLLRRQAEWQADVVHLNGYVHAALPWDRPTVVVAHSCVLSWFEAVHGKKAPAEWDEYARRVQKGLLAATQIVAPSQFMQGALSRHYGLQPDAVTVIHNFSCVAEAHAPAKKPFALAVGRMWDPAKNLHLLRQLKQPTALPIQIVGQADDSNAGDGLQHLGQLQHAACLERMRSAGVFVHPALYEPFGLSVLEAARQSCCLLLADIPSLRELWDGAAIFLPPDAPELWASELSRLEREPESACAWGQRAIEHARRYDTGDSVAAYADLYPTLALGKFPESSGQDAAA